MMLTAVAFRSMAVIKRLSGFTQLPKCVDAHSRRSLQSLNHSSSLKVLFSYASGAGKRLVVTGVGSEASEGAAFATQVPIQPKYNVRPIKKDDVEISFARSSGAGGQNVNKVSTKVDMRLDLAKASWIPDEVKDTMRQMEKNRFTSDGVLVMQSQRHRTQAQNLDDALAKLQEIIDRAVEFVTPKEADPETIKRVKAQIKAGKERRLDAKKKDSARKKERSRRDYD